MPVVGAAAAVFDAAGRVLLVQRGRPPRVGQWGLPGGMLELGERLADAAAREVREECGVEIAIGGVAGVFEPVTRDDQGRIEYHYVVIDFWAHYVRGDACAGDDAAGVAWVALDEVEAYALLPESLQVVRDAYGLWQAATQEVASATEEIAAANQGGAAEAHKDAAAD
jgi:ADP-ribose pyrophosphatase YjhB (NUDIX family)